MKYRYVTNNRLDKQEYIDLGKSILIISIIFGLAYSARYGSILLSAIWSIVFVGSAFVLHELAHKYFATKFGALARFRSNDKMLLLSLVISLLGIIFLAPGAVLIRGNLTKKQYGITSLAGPATNIVLASILLPLSIYYPVLSLGALINSFLAAFNLLPFPPFDGQKVLSWDKRIYGVSLGIAVLLFFLTQIL